MRGDHPHGVMASATKDFKSREFEGSSPLKGLSRIDECLLTFVVFFIYFIRVDRHLF